MTMDYQPPPPMRMSAYLDDVTRGRVKDPGRVTVYDLEEAISDIRKRPRPEGLALQAELLERFEQYGRKRKWLEPPADDKADAEIVANFIAEMFGFYADPQDKIAAEFRKQLTKEIKSRLLNSRGRSYFSVLEFLYEICAARTVTDALLVLGSGSSELAFWIAQRNDYFRRFARIAGARQITIRRIEKFIALHMLRLGPMVRLVGRLNPVITLTELVLVSEPLSEMDDRSMFLLLYDKVRLARPAPECDIVYGNHGSEWCYRVPPIDALRRLNRPGSYGGASRSSSGSPSAVPASQGGGPTMGPLP